MFISRKLKIAFLLTTLLWFGSLVPRHLSNPDEGRYAEIAREMVTSGDWLIPRLNGIQYFEKPPLHYWATSIIFSIFGQHDWSARLWSGITGFLTLALIGVSGGILGGWSACLWSMGILASMFLFFANGHFNNLDMGLTFFMTWILCSFLHLQEGGPWRRLWQIGLWVGLALGFLTKGLVAVALPISVVGVYMLWHRPWSHEQIPKPFYRFVLSGEFFHPLKRLGWTWGVPLFFLLAAPWFVLVSQKVPQFPYFFFVHEHFLRYTSEVHRRAEAWWFFLPIILWGTLPWTGICIQGLVEAWRKPRLRLLVLWCLLIVLFYSFSGSKLIPYILPIFPALAMLGGLLMAKADARSLRIHYAVIFIFFLVTCLVASLSIDTVGENFLSEYTPADRQAFLQWVAAALFLLLVGAGLAFMCFRKKWSGGVFVISTLLAWLCVTQAFSYLNTSTYNLIEKVRPYLSEDSHIFSVGALDRAFPFYLKRTVLLVNYRDEFDFGLTLEPHLALNTNDFLKYWSADPEAVSLMSQEAFTNFKNSGELKMEVIDIKNNWVAVKHPS